MAASSTANTTNPTEALTVRTWRIDPAHSLMEFSARHMMVTNVKGRFATFNGAVILDEVDPARSRVFVEIDASTVDTRNEQRDAHLRSEDFLHVERHPTITFRSTAIEPKGPDRFLVTGDLSIRGVSRPVTLDATLNGKGTTPFGTEVVGFSAETAINRKDWNMQKNVLLETGGVLVGDTIKITLEIEAALDAEQAP